ncbi:hypothetical protein ZWY2020_049107 [Hordeum vulgare]|nr:hypothetical protein ZWY2020_049107 [Hordeum vulgare]
MATVPWSRLCTRLSAGKADTGHPGPIRQRRQIWQTTRRQESRRRQVTLWKWWLVRLKGEERKVALSGFTEKNDLFTSASIAQRYESLTLQDEDGLSKDLFSQMRAAVRHVASLFPTAIISGRSRDKVFDFVKLTELYYAGSNGMDIMGPIRKSESNGQHVQCVRSTIEVLEVRPVIDWNKGKVVEFLLESLGLSESDDVLPIYVVDDKTDEDAFKVLKANNHGFGILVSCVPKDN